MSGRSNVILVDALTGTIAAAAYQVSPSQSIRPLQTGFPYEPPPRQTKKVPFSGGDGGAPGGIADASADAVDGGACDSLEEWRRHLSLIPGVPFTRSLVDNYRGVSPAVAEDVAGLDDGLMDKSVEDVSDEEWAAAYAVWQRWVGTVRGSGSVGDIAPAVDGYRYSMLGDRGEVGGEVGGGEGGDGGDGGDGGGGVELATPVHDLLYDYYGNMQRRSEYRDLRRRCAQRLDSAVEKAVQRVNEFDSQVSSWLGPVVRSPATSYCPLLSLASYGPSTSTK